MSIKTALDSSEKAQTESQLQQFCPQQNVQFTKAGARHFVL